MELTKKQVWALLKVVGNDNTRPALMQLKVERLNERFVAGGRLVLMATDSYKFVALYLDSEDEEFLEDKVLTRESLERWYKLADGKSRFNEDELLELLSHEYANGQPELAGKFPAWQSLMYRPKTDTGVISFDANYAKTLQDVDGVDGLEYELGGPLGVMLAWNERGIYGLMPRKQGGEKDPLTHEE